MTNSIFHRIAELGVVPVIAIDDANRAIALADALLEGGLPVAEITFRTKAAAEVIADMAQERPAPKSQAQACHSRHRQS